MANYFRGLVAWLSGLMIATASVGAGPNDALNDTGVTIFRNGTNNVLTSEPATHPGQDARYGRSAAAAAGKLPLVGYGLGGYDFTPIGSKGEALPVGSTGLCSYDNVTGLMWENKTSSGLRDSGWLYTWYDSNGSTNGGYVGVESGSERCATRGRCDTAKFVQDVNAIGLCGHSDWRMPTIKELESIAYFAGSSFSCNETYWSATPAQAADRAWLLTSSCVSGTSAKGNGNRVRLVRTGR